MIDDYAAAMGLVNKMNASLPIPARATRQAIDSLRAQGAPLGTDRQLEIKKVLYMGDAAGISCDITPAGSKKVVVCSLTYLRTHPKHPLAREIRAYQEERVRRLVQEADGPTITSFRIDRKDR